MLPGRFIRVFISSAIAELEYDREIAFDALRDMNVSPVLFELFPAMSQSPMEGCLEEVRSSDIVVMLLWKSLRQAVKEEYAEALKRSKPILVLIKSLNEGEERDAELKNFLAELTAGSPTHVVRRVTWMHYRRVQELKTAIGESIASEIAKFYREPIHTVSREEMYELGTSIVRSAQKRLCLFQRTPTFILGPRNYLADEAAKYAYEKEFADALDAWISNNYKAGDKELLYLFSANATKEEMYEKDLLGNAQYVGAVEKRIQLANRIAEQSGFRFRVSVMNVPMSGPLIVGDNRYAIWLLGKEDAVSISQENEKICDILVRMLKIHGQKQITIADVFGAEGAGALARCVVARDR